MRLAVCLEGDTEGKILASLDMEEIVKMTMTDDIEKSNFNPQMLKSCTDASYQCGYEQGKADMLREIEEAMYTQCFERNNDEDMQKWNGGNWIRYKLFENVLEQLKEKSNE